MSELNKFGMVIVNSLYFLVIAVVLIFLMHKAA